MTHNEIMEIVVSSICEETKYSDTARICATTTANDVPGWDSLAHVRIMLGIEMELDIEVPIEATYTAETVGDLAKLVGNVFITN